MSDPLASTARIAVVMGVAGSGKTTIGQLLATRLGVPFADADQFHPQTNIDKMTAGTPLTDEDRGPWLAAIGAWLAEHSGTGAIATCSALKADYREQLRQAAPGLQICHLAGPVEVAYARMSARPDHFMPPSLMQSQYDTLEPLTADEPGITVDFRRREDDIVTELAKFVITRIEA